MSQSELLYLALVGVAFSAFIIVLAVVSWDQQRHSK